MKSRMSAAPKSVDAYLSKLSHDNRAALERLRRIINAAAPDAEEVISFGMPAYRHKGMLVYIAAFKEHCSFFIGSTTVSRKFAAYLKRFDAGKGTLHFTPERQIPADLVRRLVEARLAENEARATSKRRAAARDSKKAR